MFIKKIITNLSIHLLFIYNLFSPILLFSTLIHEDSIDKELSINIICHKNGKGIETDQMILRIALEQMGCLVRVLDLEEGNFYQADINVFIETLIPQKFKWARQNWFIPNPEWYNQEVELLEEIDLILCRTKEAERIFREIKQPTYYIGFTSPDCYQNDIKKDYAHLFHLAGGSPFKGTTAIQNIWLLHPSLPLLTAIDFLNQSSRPQQSNLKWIRHRVLEPELRQLQNECGIHLCPSESEGFGHYLVEGMSAAAVIVTTDAPPMNEFITDPRCLVPYFKSDSQYLGTNYYVDSHLLKNTIEGLLNLPENELEKIGLKNRALYLQKREEFHQKLATLIALVRLAFKE